MNYDFFILLLAICMITFLKVCKRYGKSKLLHIFVTAVTITTVTKFRI